MKRKFIVALLAICLQYVTILAQNNPLIKYIPENAAMVMSFNPIKLGKNIPGETFRQSSFYESMMQKDDGTLKAFLSDPSISGIDFSNDLLMVSLADTVNDEGKRDKSVHLFGLLKNEALFLQAIKKIGKGEDSLHVYGTDKILFSANGMNTIAWNKEIFVIDMGSKKGMKDDLFYNISDTLTEVEFDKRMDEIKYELMKAKREQCFQFLSPRSNTTILNNNILLKTLSADGDLKVWNSGTGNALFGDIDKNLNPGLLGLGKFQAFTGQTKTSVVHFENGKIVVESNSYPGEEIAALYKKYPTVPLNTDLARRLPKGKLLGIFTTSYNPQLGIELMEKTGLKELFSDMKSKIPFDLNLLTTAFGNNMLLAVIKSDDIAKEDSLTRSMDGIKLLLAMPIANKAKFDQLKSSFTQVWDSLKKEDNGGKMMKDFKPVVTYNDNLFVLTLSQEVANSFLSNTGTEPVPEWLASKSNYPMFTSMNMHEVMKLILGKKMGDKNDPALQKMIDMFGQVIMYGGNYENGSLNTKMEFQFSNQNDNALKQFFDFINIMSAKKMGNSSDEKNN